MHPSYRGSITEIMTASSFLLFRAVANMHQSSTRQNALFTL
jgi:hypothetical protein